MHAVPHVAILVDPVANRLAGRPLDLIETLQRLADLDVDFVLKQASQIRFAGKVAVKGRRRGPRGFGDVPYARCAIAMLGKELQSSGHESFLGQFLVLIAQGNNLTGSLDALTRGVLGNHELRGAFREDRRFVPEVNQKNLVSLIVHRCHEKVTWNDWD